MKIRKMMLLMALVMASHAAWAAKKVDLVSPNGQVKVTINADKDLRYTVSVGTDVVLRDFKMALTLSGEQYGENPQVKKVKKNSIREDIQREVPIKNAIVKNYANEVVLEMKGGWSVVFRAYDDGVAYRFVTSKAGQVTVDDELVYLAFDDETQLTMSQAATFRQSFEELYTHVAAKDYTAEDKMNYLPLYFQTPEGYQVLFSETAVEDYPHMFLKGMGKSDMKSIFPPYPLEVEQQGDRHMIPSKTANYIAETEGTRAFPWRFFVISKDARDIVANEMEYILATPNAIGDTSWIQPGKVQWDWWHGFQAWNVDFAAGCNEATYKFYIDFASKMGVQYIIMDEGWAVSTSDPFHSNPTINLPGLIQYGKERGVRIILWLTWLEVERNFSLFEEYEKWGIAGVKIDFMDRADQWMQNFYERACKEAAKYHLLIDFHGSFKPSGLERKYPNLISYEGVRGLEYNSGCYPANSNWLPFIRNVVGPMDFTPGAMLNVQPENHRNNRENAMGSGTRAYQMALYIVFASGLQMMADTPSRYIENMDCAKFIAETPVVWDETKVLSAEPGKYCVIARRSGNRWYIGGINDNDPRDIEIDLGFLAEGTHGMTLFTDGPNAGRKATDYKMYKDRTVSANSPLTIHMARNGGFAGYIE